MPVDFTRTSRSEAETALIGAALGRFLRAGDVLLIDGPLGAGKTTLIRSIAAGMSLDTRPVASPTFVLVHEYTAPHAAPDLIHVDAYRLRDASDLDSLGWDTVIARVLEQPTAALVIEWAERLGATVLPAGTQAAHLRIEHIDQSSREFHFMVPESWRSRPGLAELAARSPTTCPVTGKRVEADSPTYPFADERARMADLYRWFSGSYSTSRDATDADFDEPRSP